MNKKKLIDLLIAREKAFRKLPKEYLLTYEQLAKKYGCTKQYVHYLHKRYACGKLLTK